MTTENILQKIIIENIQFYSANINSKEYKLEKKLYNIKKIHNSGIIEYLNEKYFYPTIILFGSYSKGEDTQTSDIDIYIESRIKNIIIPEKYEIFMKKKIQIFLSKKLFEISNEYLINSIINGITLNGFIEIKNESNRSTRMYKKQPNNKNNS